MVKEFKEELKLKRFHLQNKRKVRCPLHARYARLATQNFEAGKHVERAEWIPADLLVCRLRMQGVPGFEPRWDIAIFLLRFT